MKYMLRAMNILKYIVFCTYALIYAIIGSISRVTGLFLSESHEILNIKYLLGTLRAILDTNSLRQPMSHSVGRRSGVLICNLAPLIIFVCLLPQR